jgi:hypothetical protein
VKRRRDIPCFLYFEMGQGKRIVSWLKKRLLKKRVNRLSGEKRKTCNEIDDTPHVVGDVNSVG